MSSVKSLGYDYEELYTSMTAESLEYRDGRFKKERAQKPVLRVFNITFIFALCIGLLTPLTLIVQRQAEIHEKQFANFRLKEVAEDYKDRSNELKEALESGSSLDDLELYATERLDMVKADKSNIIVLRPYPGEIKKPSVKFGIATGSNLELQPN